jgi:hypothetical protein
LDTAIACADDEGWNRFSSAVMSFYAVVLYQLVSLSTSSYMYIVASCSLRLEVKIIVSTGLGTLVLEAIKA